MRWEDDDETVKHLIMSFVPNEIFNRIKGGTNARTWWASLKDTCEGRLQSFLIDLGRRLQNARCGEDDDIRAHFVKLANFQEQLAAMGETVSDQPYSNTFLTSLPPCYEMRICAITTNTDETGKGIDPARVIKHISDDYDKRMLSKNVDKKSEDQAFATQAQKRKKNKSDIGCYNCKKKSHIKADCWAKGGGKEGQRPGRNKPQNDKSNDNAAVAAGKTNDIESWAFMVAEEWAHSEGKESCGSRLDSEDIRDMDAESWASIEEADWADEESGAETDSARSSASEKYVQSSEDPEDSTSAVVL